jgi:uracil DNA glycosylase
LCVLPWLLLLQWCSQGVLLLNAALTVRAKNSNSHAGVWLLRLLHA